MSRTIGVAEVKRNFSEVIGEVSLKGEHFVIEKNGRPMAALVQVKELEVIEGAQKKGRGLLAAIGAWEDYDAVDDLVQSIYEKRRKAKDRSADGLS